MVQNITSVSKDVFILKMAAWESSYVFNERVRKSFEITLFYVAIKTIYIEPQYSNPFVRLHDINWTVRYMSKSGVSKLNNQL